MKTHLSLPTRDIPAGVAFYRALLDLEPAKHYDDYALFVSESPGLELVLELDATAAAPAHEHYGIVADTTLEVEAAIARLEGAGYPVDIERGETCCYAVQTKVWARDPDGRRWETYFVIEDVEARDDDAAPACC
jgi:catechol 2,3-dioxygenase-like lactoylglutathione lyase family enzyme